MQVAEKTIAFVKEWVEGKYTKRQYQNYYIVKTPEAEFLLKLTEKRELMAIKDKTNHIYIWDENDDQDNAFSQMIHPRNGHFGFVFPNGFSRVRSYKMGHRDRTESAVNSISKFRVCERVKLDNPKLAFPIYMSLIALGNRRFYTLPERHNYPTDISLEKWATLQCEVEYPYERNYPSATLNVVETLPGIEKVSEIRGHYLTLAGEKLNKSYMVEGGFITIPTDFTSVDEISGMNLLEMRKSRPNPFAYGLSPAHFDMDKLLRRYETTEENINLLTRCFTSNRMRVDLPDPAQDWRAYLHKRFPTDMATSYIAYIEEDDKWLAENYAAAHAFALEHKLRQNIGLVDGWLFGAKCDDSRFGPAAVYMKNHHNRPFDRIIPVPTMMTRIFGEIANDYE